MASEMEQQGSPIGATGSSAVPVDTLLEALRRALSMGGADVARSRFMAAVDQALLDATAAPQDAHWHLHDLALACDRAGDALLARERLEPGVDMLRRGLAIGSAGRPVEQASFTVDGGMPEHLHGLPTQPRLGRALGDGVYEIDGVRFSMGGWWEFKLAIESPAGADSVTFNLSL